MSEQRQHCTQCQGTGKVKPNGSRNPIACLRCAGTGIEPEQEQKPTYQMKHFGPFHTYPGMKRDAMIVVGLIILMLVLKSING